MVSARLSVLRPLSLGILFLAAPISAQSGRVRIIQTNAAGDNVHIIDPATNEVVDVILGIPIPHGVTSHPNGEGVLLQQRGGPHTRRGAYVDA